MLLIPKDTHMLALDIGEENKKRWDWFQERIDALELCLVMFLAYIEDCGETACVVCALRERKREYEAGQRQIIRDFLDNLED